MDFPEGCPICGGHNGGRGTCPPCGKTVDTFRRLFRNLQRWRASYEQDPDLEVLSGPDGREWLLWDIERLYSYRTVLPDQQRRCIELFLYQQYYERETADELGVGQNSKHTSVAIYATVGLIRLLSLARAGQLAGCRFDFDVDRMVELPAPVLVLPQTRVIVPVIETIPSFSTGSIWRRYVVADTPLVIEYPLFGGALL